MSGIIMVNTMLDKLGKAGILKPDADGYRWVNFGAFGTFNEGGAYYEPKSGADAVENGSTLRRKMFKGNLCGEADHPDISGMSTDDALIRMADIRTMNKSHNIANLRLVRDMYTCPKTGNPAIIVEGYIRPVNNVLGEKLEKDLQDRLQNTSFSIRCFLNQDLSTFNHRVISEIITWDWVTEPGIAVANKWQSMACENYSLMTMTELNAVEVTSDDMYHAIESLRTQGGTESTNEVLAILEAATVFSGRRARPVFLR